MVDGRARAPGDASDCREGPRDGLALLSGVEQNRGRHYMELGNTRSAAGCCVVEERKKGEGWVWRITARDDAANSARGSQSTVGFVAFNQPLKEFCPLEAGR